MNSADIRDVAGLVRWLAEGGSAQYLYFWGHRKPADGRIGKSCFSQWYEAAFEIESQRYPTAEHYMMAEKARLFGDEAVLARVLEAANPGAAKALGREVRGFDEALWTQHRFKLVVRGNLAKFGQNPALAQFLLTSGSRVLVEASPADRIWGVGLAEGDPRIAQPGNWCGLNLLGFALMEVRSQLAAGQRR